MKVLFLADVNSSHTRKWVLGLVSKGIEVSIFSMSAPRQCWYKDVNVQCVYFGADPSLQNKQSAFAKLSYLKAIKEVKSFVKKIQPDIVHAHYATSYGLLGALCGRKPYVISVWGSDIQDFPYRSKLHKLLMSYILSRSTFVCSTSKAMMGNINYVNPKLKVKMIPFGINMGDFKIKKHLKRSTLVFGTIKTLDHVYGVDVLIESFNLYLKQTSRNDRLLIVGDGVEREKLEEKVEYLGISHLVDFKGRIPQLEVPKMLQEIDIYLSLSRRESFGVSALEASSSGIPVITSEAEGFKEVVMDNVTGFRVAIEKQDKVVERMIRLQDSDLRNQMGNAGRGFVLEKFNFEKNLKDQISLYQNIINE